MQFWHKEAQVAGFDVALAVVQLVELVRLGIVMAEMLKEPPAVAVDELAVALYS